MKKALLFILYVVLAMYPGFCLADTIYLKSGEKIEGEIIRSRDDSIKLKGASGEVSIFTYADLIRAEGYFPNGNLHFETDYKDGASVTKFYYESGKVAQENFFKNGQWDDMRGYYENGALKDEEYFKNGLVVGYKEYYENGALRSEIMVKDGKVERKTFDETGKLISEK